MQSTYSNPSRALPGREVASPRASPVGDVQGSWLPSGGTLATRDVQVSCRSMPVHTYGGDLCAAYAIGEGALVVVGDVAGHHYDSAMLSALAKGACDVAVSELQPLTATRLLHVLDRTLSTSGGGLLTMSCSVAMVASRTIVAASAGHPLPWIVRDGGRHIDCVRCFGELLGTGEAGAYSATVMSLRTGDRVLWYTDGVPDTENRAGARFGYRRLRDAVKRAATLDATVMADVLAAELTRFRGEAAPADDVSFAIAAVS